MTAPREIVVPVSFGDLIEMADTIHWTLRRRSWSILRNQLWSMRETRRRSTWRPFTLGQYVTLVRMRAWMATLPEHRGDRPWWRHSARRIGAKP